MPTTDYRGNPNVQTSPLPNSNTTSTGGPPVEILSFADWVRQMYGGREVGDLSDDLPAAQMAYQGYVTQQKTAQAAQQSQTEVTVPTDENANERTTQPIVHDERDQGGLTPAFSDLDDYLREVRGRTSPTAPGAATFADIAGPVAGTIEPYVAARSAVGARQGSFADILEGLARGRSDRGTMEVRRELDRQREDLLGLARTARPGQGAGAFRAALNKIGALEGAGASEAALRNAAYEAQARGEYGQLLNAMLGADITEATNEMQAINAARTGNAQLATQTSIAGSGLAAQQAMKRADLAQNAGQFAADLGLRSRGMQDQTVLGLMNARAQLLDMAQRGEITREQMAQQMAMLNKQLASAWDIANLQSQTQLQL